MAENEETTETPEKIAKIDRGIIPASEVEVTRPGFWSEWPPALSVDCTPEYVRMCVAATELQEWWRAAPVAVRYEEGGRQYHVNVRHGDYVHHGPHPVLSRGGKWPQISMVASVGVTLDSREKPPRAHVSFRLEHDRGGFLYDQPAARFLDGYFVWLPTLAQLADSRFTKLSRQAWAQNLAWMWESQDNFFGYRDDATQEKVALILLMSSAYGKTWDGEGWKEAGRG